MSVPSWEHVKDLLHQAVVLKAEARAKFLDEVCASDIALRAELESLLSVGDGMSAEFLQSPATGQYVTHGASPDAAGRAGNLWLFGGDAFVTGNPTSVLINDLWKYVPPGP
jgi:hypothetical protein